ncbi:hypothetical protein [Delftia acidovorans]|uniref:hypothetical protein n=1 Tax=Delftia acidovorans TaxID=80866 RepID=UPI001C0BEA67|nr:hypothetical protein [Delftia acidovorans]
MASQPADSLAQTMVHEAVGHFGMRELLGDEWPHFMRHIQLGIQERDPGLLKIQAHIRRVYVDDDGQFCLGPIQEADEVAAYAAEEILCMRTGEIRPARPWTQALEAVRGRLLREGLCLERAVTRSELEGMLFLAAKHLEGGALAPARRWIGRAWEWCGSMTLMAYKHRPPTSLQESKDLLKAADAWESRKNSFGLTISLLPVLLILATFIGCMLFGLSWIAGLMARF